jgi:hypothetical protein
MSDLPYAFRVIAWFHGGALLTCMGLLCFLEEGKHRDLVLWTSLAGGLIVTLLIGWGDWRHRRTCPICRKKEELRKEYEGKLAASQSGPNVVE